MDIKNIKKEWNATILDILKAFIEICNKYHLRYYCCAGTAIGAARHHGMIRDIRVIQRHSSCSFAPINVHPFSQHLLVRQWIDR